MAIMKSRGPNFGWFSAVAAHTEPGLARKAPTTIAGTPNRITASV
jgi:hypothetical protein